MDSVLIILVITLLIVNLIAIIILFKRKQPEQIDNSQILKDEVGEDGSIGKKLWDASSNLYQAFNDLNKVLKDAEIMALRSEYKEET